jgi:hypothetical protein
VKFIFTRTGLYGLFLIFLAVWMAIAAFVSSTIPGATGDCIIYAMCSTVFFGIGLILLNVSNDT